jgi:hypothetical protein
MELAQQIRHDAVKREARNHETTIILGYSIVAVLLLIAIVLAFGGAGASSQDLAVIAAAP